MVNAAEVNRRTREGFSSEINVRVDVTDELLEMPVLVPDLTHGSVMNMWWVRMSDVAIKRVDRDIVSIEKHSTYKPPNSADQVVFKWLLD